MCGRFVLSVTGRELAESFALSGELGLTPCWSIAPDAGLTERAG